MSDWVAKVQARGGDMDALKPCPICGAGFKMGQEPKDNPYVGGKFYLYHDYGPLGSAARKCPISVSPHFDTKAEAIAAWNRRADLAAPDLAELVEALRFYADPTYNGYDVNIGNYGLSMQAGEIIKDAGDRARAALAKIKEPQT